MLKPPSPADARRLREFLAEAGYTRDEFRTRRALREIPRRSAGNIPYLLEQFREPCLRNLLLRWFFLGVPAEGEFAGLAPEPVLTLMLECGLLVRDGNLLAPAVTLTPCEQGVFAADTAARMEAQAADLVVWPNPTSLLLDQFTMRRPVESALDLGAGCGIQAVLAARHSRQVTATDLNPRAAEFTRFNAALNDAGNIECLTGDTFETAANRTFDLIVANPPFFVTPSGGQMYCENGMELDTYCRRVVREAGGHLNEGGCLQTVFEWVQVSGQSWQDRLREWLADTGCDAWVFRGYGRDAAAYARERIRQTSAGAAGPETLARWLEYYRERGVEQIHGGTLAMRRRAGRNWMRVEEMPLDPGGPFGEAVWQAFAGMDFLETHGGDDLLAARPRLSPAASLERQLRQVDGRWQPADTHLRLAGGIPASMRLEPMVADFLAGLDGRRSLEELAAALAQRAGADPLVVRRECLAVVRRLVERRFVVP